jgi:flagellar basal body-associated protein FliL
MSAPRKRALWVALLAAFVLVASAAATTGVMHFRGESAEEAAEEADGDYGEESHAALMDMAAVLALRKSSN